MPKVRTSLSTRRVQTPGQVGVGDRRHQGLLGALARGQQPVGEVGALAQLGQRQIDRAARVSQGRSR